MLKEMPRSPSYLLKERGEGLTSFKSLHLRFHKYMAAGTRKTIFEIDYQPESTTFRILTARNQKPQVRHNKVGLDQLRALGPVILGLDQIASPTLH